MPAGQRSDRATAGFATFIATHLPLVAGALGGAALVAGLTVALWSGETSQAATAPAGAAPAASTEVPCDQQTWPYLSADCLKSADSLRRVRIVSTAQGATQESRQPSIGAPVRPAPQPAAVAPEHASTAVTVRAGRQAARKVRGDGQRGAQRGGKTYAIVAGRPVELHSSMAESRALAYGEERPRTFIVPRESPFGRW